MTNSELDKCLFDKLNIKNNFDIVRGVVKNKFIVYYVSSLVDINLIQHIYQLTDLNDGYIGNIQKINSLDEIVTGILSGLLFILHLDNDSYYLIETRDYPSRGINEPETEQTIRGSKDGFCESIITNVALVRRRIRNENLMFEKYQVGTYSKCDVVIAYLKDKVNIKYLEKIKKRIANNKEQVESIIMSDRALEELLFPQKHNIYPLVKYSERPDLVSINILKGRVVILCDNSSSALITPTNIFEHLRHIEEYRQNPLVGTFLRLIRFMSILFSLILIPLWLCALKDGNNEIFLIPDESNFYKIFYQVLVAEIMIEVLKIATIHTPSKLSSTMGLVAALVLGQFAVEIGIFTQEIILYSSLSAIGGFATPSYELSLSNKIVKIIIIISIGFIVKFVIIFSLFFLFLYLVRINKDDYPYLFPFVPFKYI